MAESLLSYPFFLTENGSCLQATVYRMRARFLKSKTWGYSMVKVRSQEKYIFCIKFLRIFLDFTGHLFLPVFSSQWGHLYATKVWPWLQKQGDSQNENHRYNNCIHYLCMSTSSAQVVCETSRHNVMTLWLHGQPQLVAPYYGLVTPYHGWYQGHSSDIK